MLRTAKSQSFFICNKLKEDATRISDSSHISDTSHLQILPPGENAMADLQLAFGPSGPQESESGLFFSSRKYLQALAFLAKFLLQFCWFNLG